MLKFTLRRLLALIPKLLIISIALFIVLEWMPGDPLTRTMNPDTYSKLTEAEKEAYREAMGLNDPAIIRYFRWLGGVLQGDFGLSAVDGRPVAQKLAVNLPPTFEISLWAMILSTIIGMAMGFACAIWKNKFIDHFFQIFGVMGSSIPDFFIGMTFVIVFSLELGWFATGGQVDPYGRGHFFTVFLPIATLTFIRTASSVRGVRAQMLDVMEKDYIKTARSKGLSEFTVNFKHVLRNALIPQVTGMVLGLSVLVSGAMIVEQVFNYPGIGAMALAAQSASDSNVTLTLTMMVAVISLVASVLGDILVAMLDPRIRLGE